MAIPKYNCEVTMFYAMILIALSWYVLWCWGVTNKDRRTLANSIHISPSSYKDVLYRSVLIIPKRRHFAARLMGKDPKGIYPEWLIEYLVKYGNLVLE